MDRITATSEAEIADVVRDFGARGKSLEIISAGTKRRFGRFTQADSLLDLSALSGIVRYEPDELVITVRAATPLKVIEEVLAEKNQMLAFSPVDWGPLFGVDKGRATLAGIVATNGCGSRRVKAGAVRDHLIGCRFVNGTGEAIRAGGKVVKNVTGFDIPKLMCGAFGTLGVLTELTFRVVPQPESASAVIIRTDTHEEGLRALRHTASLPIEPTALAYRPRGLAFAHRFDDADSSKAAGHVLVRVEGNVVTVTDKIELLRQTFGQQVGGALNAMTSALIFDMVANAEFIRGPNLELWRLVIPSTAAYEAIITSAPALWLADWAGSLLWLALPADETTAKKLRAITARVGGYATLVRGSEKARAELNVFEPEPSARAALTRSVKAAFDPKRVLNPGRMYRDV